MTITPADRALWCLAAVVEVEDALTAAGNRLPAIREAAAAGHIGTDAAREAERAARHLAHRRIAALAEHRAARQAT